jgi:hypothetical protein
VAIARCINFGGAEPHSEVSILQNEGKPVAALKLRK